jgi:leucyl-tRNA synthetase
LLYSRFWHKVLFDRGYVSTPEPFQKLVNQGMILGEPQFHATAEGFKSAEAALAEKGISGIRVEDEDGKVSYVLVNQAAGAAEASNLREDQIEKRKGAFYVQGTDLPLVAKADKMSKSRGNVVNPDHVVREYGADSLRLYEMFMGPLEASKPWSMAGVVGVRNFLDRAWRMIVDDRAETVLLNAAVSDEAPTDEQNRVLHKTIQAVTDDTAALGFNTAIARMMEFVNFFTRQSARPRACLEPFVLLLSPYAPHLAEELWQALGHDQTLAYEPWPQFDERLARDEEIEIPVQIKGKVRTKILVRRDIGQDELEQTARNDDRVKELLADQQVVKTIVVPGRLVNFVTK